MIVSVMDGQDDVRDNGKNLEVSGATDRQTRDVRESARCCKCTTF